MELTLAEPASRVPWDSPVPASWGKYPPVTDAEKRAFQKVLHEDWRLGRSKLDTEIFIPKARRRIRAIAQDLYYLGINPDFALRALKKTVLERKPLDKDGYLVEDGGRGLYIIEVNEDIMTPKTLELIRWHELSHMICLVGGRGSTHGIFWKAVVRLLGFPEEARDFPDEV